MKNKDINELYQELLNDIKEGKYFEIINTYIHEDNIRPDCFYKINKLDKKFNNKRKKSKEYEIEYLVTTYYENPEHFNMILDKISDEDLELLEKYVKKKELGDDILDNINSKVLEKKRKTK